MQRKSALALCALMALSLALLTACGGKNGLSDVHHSSSGGGSTSTGDGSSPPPSGGDETPPSELAAIGYTNDSGKFEKGKIHVGEQEISAGGTSGLHVNLVDGDGKPYTDSATVTFTSNCANKDHAEFSSASVTTKTGDVVTSFTDKGCGTNDTITATVTSGSGQELTATGTINIKPAALGSIEYVVPKDPIALKMQQFSAGPHRGTVTFKVLNESGGPVPQQEVNFSLTNTSGGTNDKNGVAHLQSTSAKTNGDGEVSTVVIAGREHGSVRVTATAVDADGNKVLPPTDSQQITVSTGIPVYSHFSVGVDPKDVNQEAADIQGIKYTVSAGVADSFSTALPGITVNFAAKYGGRFNNPGSCKTDETGSCSITFISGGERPSDNIIRYLAYTKGAEHFEDKNNNDAYDEGEDFTDLPVNPFIDENNDGKYNPGKELRIINDTNFPVGAGNGKYDGPLCNSGCGDTTTTLSIQGEFVESGSLADIQLQSGSAITIGGNGDTKTVKIVVTDGSKHAMAPGTKISAKTTNGFVTITSGGDQTQDELTAQSPPPPSASVFSIGLKSNAGTSTSDKGSLEITVTSKAGIPYSQSFPITLN